MKTSVSLAVLISSAAAIDARAAVTAPEIPPALTQAGRPEPNAPERPGAEATRAAPVPSAAVSTLAAADPSADIAVKAAELELQTPGPSQEDLDGIRSDLENFKFQWQRERELRTALTTRALTIGGIVQARGGASDTAVSDANVNDRQASFDLGATQVFFNGNLFKDYEEGRNLGYSVRFGVAGGSAPLNLLDANVTYSLLPTISPEEAQLTVTLGQQLLPFGLEVAATEELRPVISNAQFTTAANGGFNLNRRELALIVRGDLVPRMDYGYNYRQALIAYALGILNGAGPNSADDNTFKDIIGRVAFTVPSDYNSWLRQLTFGGTVYYGKQNRRVVDGTKATLLEGLGRRERYGVDVYYNHHPIGITYEYIEGRDGIATGRTVDDPQPLTVRSRGHVVTFFYNFGEQFVRGYRNQGRYDDWWPKSYQPFVRADLWNPNRARRDDRSNVYTLGFNVFFAETTKFQLNLNHRDLESAEAVNEALAQLQFGF